MLKLIHDWNGFSPTEKVCVIAGAIGYVSLIVALVAGRGGIL